MNGMTPAGAREDEEEAMSSVKASRHWQMQLHAADRDQKDWHEHGRKIEQRYRSDRDAMSKTKQARKRFAILYSNTETLKTALFARTPKPDVRRRFGDRNPVARTVAEILERTLSYCADNTTHDRAYRAGVHDMCLPGRGVVWYVYEAQTEAVPQIDPMTGQPMMGPDGQPMTQDRIADQEVKEAHVYWQDFRWEPGRCWADVTWISRRHRMTREDLQQNQFDDAANVPLNWTADISDRNTRDIPDEMKRAEVWEIWCKRTKRRYWIVKGHPKALRIDDDPLELQSFWPIAEPLTAVLGTDTYVPGPFYAQYEDQADDLDEITGRISHLVKALRRRGIYDASVSELKRLARAGDNEFIPVDGQKYALVMQAGGLKRAFDSEDLKPIADTLVGLYEQRDRLIASIYEVSGISDIVRGSSNPNETATAQNIKAQFGSMRLRDSQRGVQTWIRDGYRIKAEIIAQNFTPQKLAAITGMDANDPTFHQAVQVLRSDELRAYQIDIETDSTVFEDAEAEKQGRVELLTAMGGFAQQWMPVVQAAPEMMKLVGEMMSFGVRGFKAGRSMEDVIDETMQAIQQRMAQPQQQPPDPTLIKVEAEMKRDEQRHQMDMQTAQIDQQGKMIDLQAHQQKTAIDLEKAQAMAAFQRETQMSRGLNGPEARNRPQ